MAAEKISLDIDIFSEVFLYLYTRKPTLYMDIYILDLMGSNRTFMELKWRKKHPYEFCGPIVLIVPLWNWNQGTSIEDDERAERSNRTFMELKYGQEACISRRKPLF